MANDVIQQRQEQLRAQLQSIPTQTSAQLITQRSSPLQQLQQRQREQELRSKVQAEIQRLESLKRPDPRDVLKNKIAEQVDRLGSSSRETRNKAEARLRILNQAKDLPPEQLDYLIQSGQLDSLTEKVAERVGIISRVKAGDIATGVKFRTEPTALEESLGMSLPQETESQIASIQAGLQTSLTPEALQTRLVQAQSPAFLEPIQIDQTKEFQRQVRGLRNVGFSTQQAQAIVQESIREQTSLDVNRPEGILPSIRRTAPYFRDLEARQLKIGVTGLPIFSETGERIGRTPTSELSLGQAILLGRISSPRGIATPSLRNFLLEPQRVRFGAIERGEKMVGIGNVEVRLSQALKRLGLPEKLVKRFETKFVFGDEILGATKEGVIVSRGGQIVKLKIPKAEATESITIPLSRTETPLGTVTEAYGLTRVGSQGRIRVEQGRPIVIGGDENLIASRIRALEIGDTGITLVGARAQLFGEIRQIPVEGLVFKKQPPLNMVEEELKLLRPQRPIQVEKAVEQVTRQLLSQSRTTPTIVSGVRFVRPVSQPQVQVEEEVLRFPPQAQTQFQSRELRVSPLQAQLQTRVQLDLNRIANQLQQDRQQEFKRLQRAIQTSQFREALRTKAVQMPLFQQLQQRQAQRLRTQITTPRITRVPPRTPPIIHLPLSFNIPQETQGQKKFREALNKAYRVFVKRRGKDIPIATGLPRGRALRLGQRVTSETLGARFRIEETDFKTRLKDVAFNLGKEFRAFRIQKGKKIPLQDEFIERRRFRLSLPSEVREIQRARRRKR